MNGTLYHVVYKGEILSGFDMEAVCKDLARISSTHSRLISSDGRSGSGKYL